MQFHKKCEIDNGIIEPDLLSINIYKKNKKTQDNISKMIAYQERVQINHIFHRNLKNRKGIRSYVQLFKD